MVCNALKVTRNQEPEEKTLRLSGRLLEPLLYPSMRTGSELTASFAKKWTAVAPGQAAVLYDAANTEVLGGGRIASWQESQAAA